MSTAIMHSAPFYDFGDLIMKNQTATRTTQMTINTTNSSNAISALINNNNLKNNNNNNNGGNLSPILFQQNMNVAAAAVAVAQAQQQQQQQQQQQHQHHQHQQKLLIHNALTRAVSHPAGTVDTLMNSITEILRVSTHRKLERTQSEPLPQQVNTSRYKTELCRPFEEAGECKYGDKCQFAHGMHELRNLQRHPKYKTELCRTFHSVGFCPYGPRCHFVHNAEEARNHNRSVAAYHARLAAQRQAAQQGHHHLPLSPALSMSTGSDRASPIGSLSLSPTTSMASFFPEQNSPTFAQGFTFPQTPPASPIDNNMSRLTLTPPPMTDDARLPVFNRLSLANLAI